MTRTTFPRLPPATRIRSLIEYLSTRSSKKAPNEDSGVGTEITAHELLLLVCTQETSYQIAAHNQISQLGFCLRPAVTYSCPDPLLRGVAINERRAQYVYILHIRNDVIPASPSSSLLCKFHIGNSPNPLSSPVVPSRSLSRLPFG